MSDRNRDRLIAGILFYKEEIKNSEDREYIEKCQKKMEKNFANSLSLSLSRIKILKYIGMMLQCSVILMILILV